MSFNNTQRIHILIETFDLIYDRFARQLPLIITLLGVSGFLGNCLTYLQTNLRSVPFCIYTLFGSFIDTINIFTNLFPVYLNPIAGNLVDAISNRLICKLKLFALVFLPQFSMNLLILSLIDRYVSTFGLRSTIQKFFKAKMIPWLILITAIITCPMTIHAPIAYDIVPNLGCVSTRPTINATLYMLIHGILTPLVMLMLIFLIHRRFKSNRQRVDAILLTNVKRLRSQLILMVFTQAFVTSLFTLQWCIFYTYMSITQYKRKSIEERSIFHFISFISNTLYYLINVRSFYLSTLTFPIFRHTAQMALFKYLPKEIYSRINKRRYSIVNTRSQK